MCGQSDMIITVKYDVDSSVETSFDMIEYAQFWLFWRQMRLSVVPHVILENTSYRAMASIALWAPSCSWYLVLVVLTSSPGRLSLGCALSGGGGGGGGRGGGGGGGGVGRGGGGGGGGGRGGEGEREREREGGGGGGGERERERET